ncbi:28S rRNA (cytosine-C(5))-methyltransferase-like [Corticium candelabrum]|uniref:28S rRNA (cytosine-C(5))-methyltransferase-like n=1 Tax=Corticium candelabrum TaxID=121492 RepID=UPI002E2752C3|nr:28S rRNA (cytosine-C(5))-methyltransferase-like [Corticium candelabrum]
MALLYTQAASVLDSVQAKQSSLKTIVHSSELYKNKKQLVAVVCRTLQSYETLVEIVRMVRLLTKEPQLTLNVACVLVYDYLFGGGLRCGGKLKSTIFRHKTQLKSAVERLKVKRGVTTKRELIAPKSTQSVVLPRYVRVNTIKCTMADVVAHFESEGMMFRRRCESWGDIMELIESGGFVLDPHVDDVLVFRSSLDLHRHELYTLGHIILQGKASCLPAKLLAPPPGSLVLDACAAPGNKTSHLASIMKNSGTIFAFDLDVNRLDTMRTLLDKAGVTCAVLKHQDFLTVDPEDVNYSKVEYILVDPSCSGSGCLSHVDRALDKQDKPTRRLRRLQKFQLAVLLHSFKFSSAKRIVYSTCSTYAEENEGVVSLALEQCNNTFHLTNVMPEWPRRGLPVFTDAAKCIRTSTEDMMQGFFIAAFERAQQNPNPPHTQVMSSRSAPNTTRLPPQTQSKSRKRKRTHKSVVD